MHGDSPPQRDRPVLPAATPSPMATPPPGQLCPVPTAVTPPGQPMSPIPAAVAPSAESVPPWGDKTPPAHPHPRTTEQPKEEASCSTAGQPPPVPTAPCPAEMLPHGSTTVAPTAGKGAPSDAKSPLGSTAQPPKDVPPKDTPSKDIPRKDMPSKDVPSKDASPKDTPSKDVAPKDVPPKGDRATPAAASPSSAASPRPKQGGCSGEGRRGSASLLTWGPSCPLILGCSLFCSDCVSLQQMLRRPRHGTGRRRSGERSGPSTWVRSGAGRESGCEGAGGRAKELGWVMAIPLAAISASAALAGLSPLGTLYNVGVPQAHGIPHLGGFQQAAMCGAVDVWGCTAPALPMGPPRPRALSTLIPPLFP